MPKAEKLPSGNWRARAFYYVDGKRRNKSFTGTRKSEVERLAAEFEERAHESVDDPTVGDAIENYIRQRAAVLSPSTIREYKKMQRNYYEGIKDVKVSRLTSDVVQVWINTLVTIVSPKTIRNAYGLFSSAVKHVDPHFAVAVTLPAARRRASTTPDDETIKLLLSEAEPSMRLAICLSAIGSFRRGEICAIKHSDINGCVVHVHADLVRDEFGIWQYKPTPKNSTSDRYVELPQAIIDMIPPGDKDDYIVPIYPDYLTKKFCILRSKYGLKTRFHDLRHYYVSISHVLRIPDQYIMDRGGYSTDKTMKEVYRNTFTGKRKEYADIINDHLKDIIPDG